MGATGESVRRLTDFGYNPAWSPDGTELVFSSAGFDIPGAARATKRVPCSACGLSKRHLFDKAALDGGYDVVVTGHNLDDEAAVLFGNVLRWETSYLGRQHPVLPAADGFVLWTRLAPDPLVPGGGMPAVGAPVRWFVATDDAMRDVVREGVVVTGPDRAHAVHAVVDGLEPDRPFWFRFAIGDHETEIAPSEGATRKPFARVWVHVEHLMIEDEPRAGGQHRLRLGIGAHPRWAVDCDDVAACLLTDGGLGERFAGQRRRHVDGKDVEPLGQ